MVFINSSEEKFNEIKVIFINGDQLSYLLNLKLTTVHNSIFFVTILT